MLIAVFGTPSPLTYWIVNFVRIVADVVFGSHCYIAPITIADLREAWDARGGKPVVLHSDIPQREIVDLFVNLKVPIFVVVDDAADVVGYLRASRDLDLKSALRHASQSFSILANLNAYDEAELVGPAYYDVSVPHIFNLAIDQFGIAITEAQYWEVLARFGQEPRSSYCEPVVAFVLRDFPLAGQPGRHLDSCSASEAEIIAKVIGPYGDLLESRLENHWNSIVWPSEIFPDRDNPEKILDGPRSLIGPARILFGGHTLHLPAGKWSALVRFEVAGNLSGNRLLSQIYSGDRPLSSISAKLPTNGLFEYELDFTIHDAFYPLQLLIAIAEGAIEGEILLCSAAFTNVDAT